MADIFIQDPVYITVQELKDSTTNALIDAESDDNNKKIITEAQDIIDQYIGSYPTKADENQYYIFPTIDDWIPLDIQKATVLLCENLANWGYYSWKAYNQSWSSWNILVEKYWPHSVMFDNTTSWINTSEQNKYVDEQVYRYLEYYITNWIQAIPWQQWFKV